MFGNMVEYKINSRIGWSRVVKFRREVMAAKESDLSGKMVPRVLHLRVSPTQLCLEERGRQNMRKCISSFSEKIYTPTYRVELKPILEKMFSLFCENGKSLL